MWLKQGIFVLEMTSWPFILITIVLMKTKDPRAINAEVPLDNLSPHNESMEIEKRLPEDVVPKKYVITISPDFNKNEFHGNVRIDLELLNVSNFDMINKIGLYVKYYL